MNRDELKDIILSALIGVAPEADPATLRDNVPLRDQLDLDSMDFLNFIIAIHKRLGLEIAETDYPHFATLSSAISFLESKLSKS